MTADRNRRSYPVLPFHWPGTSRVSGEGVKRHVRTHRIGRRGFASRRLLVALGLALAALASLASSAHAVTPLSGRIFALSDIADTRGDLFRTNTSGGWVRLTTGLSYPESVSAAPNGRFATLCATRNSGGTYRIYRVSANGGRLKNLIGNRRGCAPTVSPDGKKVAYLQSGGSGPSLLRVVSTNGGKPRTIYKFCASCIFQPVWAGRRIYFERRVTRDPLADQEIYSVRARDGKGLRRHTNDGGAPIDYSLKDVSSDGSKILVLLTDTSGSPRKDVVFLRPNGSELTNLWPVVDPADEYAGAAIAPGGSRVAFTWKSTGAYGLFITGCDPFLPCASSYSNPTQSGAMAGSGPYSIDWVRR